MRGSNGRPGVIIGEEKHIWRGGRENNLGRRERQVSLGKNEIDYTTQANFFPLGKFKENRNGDFKEEKFTEGK